METVHEMKLGLWNSGNCITQILSVKLACKTIFYDSAHRLIDSMLHKATRTKTPSYIFMYDCTYNSTFGLCFYELRF